MEGFSFGESDAEFSGFQFDDLRIENSLVTLIQSDGTVTDVSGLALNIDGMIPQGPINWTGNATINAVAITLSGRFEPLLNGTDNSIKLRADFADSTTELNGTLAGADFEGRLTVVSPSAALYEQALYKIMRQRASTQLPTEPLEIDARLNLTESKGSIETKRLMLGSTSARAEATLLGKDKQHFTARLAIGTVNLDEWQYLQPEKIDSINSNKQKNNSNLFGNIEVTVDAISWHGEAVRQIDLALGLNGETVNLTTLQALVPGGGTLSMGGKYQMSDVAPSYAGRIGLKTGRLRDLLVWFGADLADLPPERLMSLDWRSAMTLNDKRFKLVDIKAKLDDSAVTGSLTFAKDFSVSDVNLAIDKINLDAYMPATAPENVKSATSEKIKAPEHIQLSVGDLIFNDTQLNQVVMRTEGLEGGNVTVTSRAGVFGGSISLSGNVHNLISPDRFELTLIGNGINKSAFLGYMRQATTLSNSVGGKELGFKIKLDGTFDNLLVDAAIKSGSDKLNATGSLSYSEGSISNVDMQGKLDFATSNAVLDALDIEGAKGPTSLDFMVDGNMTKAVSLRIAGSVAGSNLITKGIWTPQTEGSSSFKGDINLAFGVQNTLPTSLQYIPALAGLRLKSDIDYSTTLIAMHNIDVAIAGGRISGDVQLSGPDYKTVAGIVTVAGVQVEDADSKEATLNQPWSKQNFHPLPTSGMQGSLDLEIKSLSYKGQDVSDSKGKLSFTDNGVDASFTKLTLNKAPAKFAFSVEDAASVRKFDMAFDATSIRMAPLLKSLTGSIVTDGIAELSFDARGSGKSAFDLVSSLKGQGKMHATAGTFKFMDLSKLVGVLRNPASAVTAIQSIGGMLGKGNTSFSQLDGTMVMDKGILTLTSLKGSGDWGTMDITGPVNLVNETMNLNGAIALSQPQDVPEIGMSFTGPITQPRKKFQTQTLLRYVLTKVNILRQQDAQDATQNPVSPAEDLVGKAFDFLGKLKKKKEDEK